MTPALDLTTLVLEKGAHADPADGMCVMEAVAYVANEPFSDHPRCASPLIATFLRTWNDDLGDDDRQILRPFVPRLIGTATTAADEERRAWLATDWLTRECAPAFLRLAGLEANAVELEQLAELDSTASAEAAQPALSRARAAGAAAWDAAWDAAGAAAWDAAGDAAWDAARDAAWAAARDAARDAARAAARDAARDAAGDAAWDAAGAAAGAAARDAARDAAGDAARAAARPAAGDAAWDAARDAAGAAAWDAAWAAAWDAARDALAPTVAALQSSALGLLERMIAVGAEQAA